ncbi:MAG: hypothetical protein HYZ20_00610 [Burkholderiales bacterium]|nr:hypothetical protein [Burkholderiales bacterium]
MKKILPPSVCANCPTPGGCEGRCPGGAEWQPRQLSAQKVAADWAASA